MSLFPALFWNPNIGHVLWERGVLQLTLSNLKLLIKVLSQCEFANFWFFPRFYWRRYGGHFIYEKWWVICISPHIVSPYDLPTNNTAKYFKVPSEDHSIFSLDQWHYRYLQRFYPVGLWVGLPHWQLFTKGRC